ncbi:hypothetical protein [Streptomyces sp. MMBL 11-3]|uniref:hypothetical protein n=1 Tax=Streptomyces sp. MMBL 11-3 TaxID=3382639 RepID=UPI0039B3CAB3
MVLPESEILSGDEYGTMSLPPRPENDTVARLVIGQIAKTTREVTCTWKGHTSTKVGRASADTEANTADPVMRSIKHSPYDWFVCLAPKSTEYEGIKVTR